MVDLSSFELAKTRKALFEGDPEPQRLFDHAFEAFKKINDERGLEHP